MWVNLLLATRPRCSAPLSGSAPSAHKMRHNPSTPAMDKCAGRAYRHEIKIHPDPAADRWKASYADKSDFRAVNSISLALDLNPSQKRYWQRSLHFPRLPEEFPACWPPPWVDLCPHRRGAGRRRSLSRPAVDGADRRPCRKLRRPDLHSNFTEAGRMEM